MTIGSNYIITFGDLRQHTLSLIATACSNVGSNTVPAFYKANGDKWTINLHKQKAGVSGSGGNMFVKATVADDFMVNLAKQTISTGDVGTQLDAFLQSRGIYNKADTVMSFKSIVNYFNNVSSFIGARIIRFYSPHDNTNGTPASGSKAEGNKDVRLYNNGSVTYTGVSLSAETPTYYNLNWVYKKPSEPYSDSSTYTDVPLTTAPTLKGDSVVSFSSSELQSSVTNFLNSLKDLNSIHQVLVTISTGCCSSSSSSSSSSSCSSSSSSTFIAYMDI